MANLTPDEEATKQSYDLNGSAWAKQHEGDWFWEPEYKKLKQHLDKGKILEIGSGSGRDAKVLVDMGFDYVGTDISQTFVDIAKSKVPGKEVLMQSVYELSYPEEFDGFWACAVLLHVPKARINEALQRIKSLMKTGAVGFISVKGERGEKVISQNIKGKIFKRFFAFWTKAGFEKVLKRNGYEVIDYEFRLEGRTRWHCFYVKVK